MLQVKWLIRASETAGQKGHLEVISSTLPLKASLLPRLHPVSHAFIYPSLENLQTWQILYLSSNPVPPRGQIYPNIQRAPPKPQRGAPGPCYVSPVTTPRRATQIFNFATALQKF